MAVDEKWIRNVPEERQPRYYQAPWFKLSQYFDQDVFKDAMTYKAKDDDLFLATFPKSGTHWVQNLVYQIQHEAETFESIHSIQGSTIFLEKNGREAAEKLLPPKSIKTHLNGNLIPWNDRAKYIVVIRNPKDVVVSFYHHTKGLDVNYKFSNGSFDDFFDLFIGGQGEFGDYFAHANSWLTKKDLPNVMIITYEFMKANIKDALVKIAHFMDEKYGQKVESDADYLNKIIQQSSIKFMKDKYSTGNPASSDPKFSFFRKGTVNDWKNMLTKEQNQRLTDRFKEEAAKNVALSYLWNDFTWLHDEPNFE